MTSVKVKIQAVHCYRKNGIYILPSDSWTHGSSNQYQLSKYFPLNGINKWTHC